MHRTQKRFVAGGVSRFALFWLVGCGGESHTVTPSTAQSSVSQADVAAEAGAKAPTPSRTSSPAATDNRPAGASRAPATAQSQPAAPLDSDAPALFWLEIGAGTVTRAAADGSGARVIASGAPLSAPDGVTVDPVGKHFFVLNMGNAIGGANSGSLVRYDLDGSNPEVIMKPGTKVGDITFNTGKQVTIDAQSHKLYLGDREGSKVWRCDYDGQNLEVLVSGHDINQVVGVGADPKARQFYFSDRNGKKLFRANMDMPKGQTHENRDDVELLYVDKSPSAMPLDIELDVNERMVYWTDRYQNKVFGMSMDMPNGETPTTRSDVKTIASNLTQAIGLALDHESGVLYVTHAGSVSTVKTDGSDLKVIGSNGSTGITFAKLQ